jgi:hypothetical protein
MLSYPVSSSSRTSPPATFWRSIPTVASRYPVVRREPSRAAADARESPCGPRRWWRSGHAAPSSPRLEGPHKRRRIRHRSSPVFCWPRRWRHRADAAGWCGGSACARIRGWWADMHSSRVRPPTAIARGWSARSGWLCADAARQAWMGSSANSPNGDHHMRCEVVGVWAMASRIGAATWSHSHSRQSKMRWFTVISSAVVHTRPAAPICAHAPCNAVTCCARSTVGASARSTTRKFAVSWTSKAVEPVSPGTSIVAGRRRRTQPLVDGPAVAASSPEELSTMPMSGLICPVGWAP